jgi:predicted small metal-binding protein
VQPQRRLFADLDRTGPFHRDSAVGRIFHPGTASFREITPNDSLHIAVSPDNHVTVHVDRLSPLAIRPGGDCGYSVVRAVAHNVVHLVEAAARRCRGRGTGHRCELECEAGGARQAGPGVYEFSCRAAGAGGCGWVARATSEEELVAKVAEHARRVHGVRQLTGTIAAYALEVARAGGAAS